MAKQKKDKIDLLLSKLDKTQFADFIRKECSNNRQFQDRFLALGAGTLFKPEPKKYASRVKSLIKTYSDRYGFIEYRATFDFNRAVTKILDEADEAIKKGQWDVAIAVLTGIASVAEDIISSGDDSAGELGAIVDGCFATWHELAINEALPENIKAEIFELALFRFNDRDLEGWDWWWDWIEMAIDLADTPEKQNRTFMALDAINPDGDSWSAKFHAKTAQKYKLKIMSRCSSAEEQVKFMYDNVANPDFRKKLIQMAWDKGDYDEVLRLAGDGVNHDAQYAGLVSDWHKWEYKAYRATGDQNNELRLARHFFFSEGRWGEKEYTMESMYSVLKSLVPREEWDNYAKTLISEAEGKKDIDHLLYIYTQEGMWQEYMDYIRKNPAINNIDKAPEEVKKLFKGEIVKLYATAVRNYFQYASNRDSYREGVECLRKLLKYGGTNEAQQIVTEQKSRTPRRPALIDELSKL